MAGGVPGLFLYGAGVCATDGGMPQADRRGLDQGVPGHVDEQAAAGAAGGFRKLENGAQ